VNNRIAILKRQLFEQTRKISLERALLYTKSYRQTKGQPTVVRRALATAYILDHIKISIRQGELIVGNQTIKPRSGIISPEMDPYWLYQELDSPHLQPPFYISEQDKLIYQQELYPYWRGQSKKDLINGQINKDFRGTIIATVFTLNQTDMEQSSIVPNYSLALTDGLESLLVKLRKQIKNRQDDFYEAALLVMEAAQRYILRYAKLATAEASIETDQSRKDDLYAISRCANKVAYSKPDNFYEACQLLWFICLIAQLESNDSSRSLGRFDQYMLSFYRHDLLRGCSRNKLQEILECFYLKTNDIVLIQSTESAKYLSEFPSGYTLTLGGLTATGRSAVNDLSYLCLECYNDMSLPQPNLAITVSKLTDWKFLNKTAETIWLSTGILQLLID
jgi:formate C-acetyltransferase